jgi:hypothetical protein
MVSKQTFSKAINEIARRIVKPRQAATIMLTADIAGEIYILLNAVDPRWRLDREGKYDGMAALDQNGNPVLLPLRGFKFIGGYKDEKENPIEAGLRELREEAGEKLAEEVRKSNTLETVYTMTRASDLYPWRSVTISYIHAHIKVETMDALKDMIEITPAAVRNRGLERLRDMIAPHDDAFAIVIAKATQIQKLSNGEGYAIIDYIPRKNIVENTKWVPIDYWNWKNKNIPYAPRRAFDVYNEKGPKNLHIGIEMNSLNHMNVGLYVPKNTKPDAEMTSLQVVKGFGEAVPDGAIFTQLAMTRALLMMTAHNPRSRLSHALPQNAP